MSQTAYNFVGGIILLPLFFMEVFEGVPLVRTFTEWIATDDGGQIATVNLIFNALPGIILFVLLGPSARLLARVWPETLEERVRWDGRGGDVVALVAVCAGEALDGLVGGIGSAAGENDRCLVATQQAGNLATGLVHRRFGPLPVGVSAGRVAEMLVDIGQHRLGHLRVAGSGGVVVQVNRVHYSTPTGCQRLVYYNRIPDGWYHSNRL